MTKQSALAIGCAVLMVLSLSSGVRGEEGAEVVQLLALGSVSTPTGSLGDSYNTGFRGLAGVAYRPDGLNFKGRVTVSYSHFDVPDVPGGESATRGGLKFLGGQADILFLPPLETRIQPYIFVGYGIYGLDYDTIENPRTDTTPDVTDDAIGGGIGIEIPVEPVEIILETSYFHVFQADSFETLYFTAGLGFTIDVP